MLFLSIGVGNDKSIKSEFGTASSMFVVAENFLFFITSSKISLHIQVHLLMEIFQN